MDNFLLSIIFGLVAMLGWGVGDIFPALASRKIGALKTYFWTRIVGLSLASLYFFKTQESFPLELGFILPLVLAGILDFIGSVSFFKGFNLGQVSIVAPVSSSWALITVILSVLFFKERLSLLQAGCVFLIMVGIWLVSLDLKGLKSNKKIDFHQGVKQALIAMLSWGLMAFLFVLASRKSGGWYLPIMFYRSVGVLVFCFYRLASHQPFGLGRQKPLFFKLIIPSGLFDIVANLSFNFGSLIGLASVVSPIASAFGAVTAIMGVICFKEKLFPPQILGIISIISGIVILSI
jgi:drug/metabolite transporter (DMT)-like permease